MFKMITWPQYLFAVAALLVLYYAYVALVYYRVELTRLVTSKGKAVDKQAPASPPTSLLNHGPLIPKAMVALPLSKDAQEASKAPAAPATGNQTEEVEENDQQEQDAAGVAETTIEKNQEVESKNDFINHIELNTEKFSKFTDDKTGADSPVVPDEPHEPAEELDDDFTVGVTQLNSYFERAAEGSITQQQLVKEIPALKNTDVLVAFFKNSTKNAQQLTATTYAEIAEPVLD